MTRVIFTQAALGLVALGFKVFPLAEGRKTPAIPKADGGQGFRDATNDPAVISKWGARCPHANAGIATGRLSGVVVVDVDPRNGGDETIKRLKAVGHRFAAAPLVRTGNGGWHWYGRWEPGLVVCAKLGPGVDIKTCGGYVVAPPSFTRPSRDGPGGPYTWLVRPGEDCIFPPLPNWLVDQLRDRRHPPARASISTVNNAAAAERSLNGAARKVAAAPVGSRNAILNWAAFRCGKLVAAGKLTRECVHARLEEAGLAAGLTLPEVRRTLESGLRAGSQIQEPDR